MGRLHDKDFIVPLAAGLGIVLTSLPGVALAQASDVIVIGRKDVPTQTGISKLDAPIVDQPQTISAVGREEMDARGVTTVDDALRTVPGISLGAGEYSFQGSNVIIRGFTSRNDMFLDGMRDFGYYFRDTFNANSVEVLKGSASILFGRGSTGGVINQSSKAPFLGQRLELTGSAGTDKTGRLTLDSNTVIGDSAALRVNAMVHTSEVAGQDGGYNHRWGLAPSLAFGLGTDTRVTASYFHQSEDNRPDYGIPWFNGAPAQVDRRNFYGFPQDYFKSDVDIATVSADHDYSATSRVHAQVRYSADRRDFRITEAQIPAGTPVTTPLASITVNRLEFEGSSRDRFLEAQGDWHGEFQVGSVRNQIVTGVELGREWAAPNYITHTGVPGTNLVTPDTTQPYSFATRYLRLTARTTADSASAFAMDTLSLTDRFQLIGGVRYDRFKAAYASVGYNPNGTVAATTVVNRVDAAPSGRLAAVWKPNDQSSVYAAYGNSFNPSAEGIESLISSGRALTQSNLNLDPEKSHNLEAGAKTMLFDGRAMASLAVFQLDKTNVRVPDPTTPGFNMLGGEQRVRGFEIELAGQITKALQLRANYAYLDSETTKSAAGGPLVGAPLVVTPKNSGAVWGMYDATDKLKFGAGVRYVGPRLGQNTAAAYLTAPGYTVADAMVEYAISPKVSVKLNINNISDATYYDMLHPFHVTPGAGRSALLTLTYRR